MKIEIIFNSSSTPKQIENVQGLYTKGDLLCVRVGNFIFKYPLCNVFSVCHEHGPHWGSNAHQESFVRGDI